MSTPVPVDPRYGPVSTRSQPGEALTDVDRAWLKETASAGRRLKNSVFNPANLISTAGSVVLKAHKYGFSPASAASGFKNAGKEVFDQALARDIQRLADKAVERDAAVGKVRDSARQVVPTALTLYRQAASADALGMEKFRAEFAGDANLGSVSAYLQAWTDVKDGIDAATKTWWVPPSAMSFWRGLRGKSTGYYFTQGLVHGRQIHPMLGDDPSRKEILERISRERGDEFQEWFSKIRPDLPPVWAGWQRPGVAPSITGSSSALPAGSILSGAHAASFLLSPDLVPASAPPAEPAVVVTSASSGSSGGGGVGDVLSAANASIEQVREALLLTAQALEALDEARRVFAQGAEGSTEQGPKDVLASYGDADEDLDSATALMYGAERNAVEWTSHL